MLEIPEKYLECKPLEKSFTPSERAYSGDLKLFSIEQSAHILYVESEHEKCVNNAESAKKYQKQNKEAE